MPGLVGIITKRPKAWAEETVCNMLKTMLHEPFYSSGVWSDPSLGVYVGWVATQGSREKSFRILICVRRCAAAGTMFPVKARPISCIDTKRKAIFQSS